MAPGVLLFGRHDTKEKDVEILESVQRTATKMIKSLEAKSKTTQTDIETNTITWMA